MGVKLSELEEGSHINLHIKTENADMDMDASIVKIAKDNIAIISIDFPTKQRLNFDNVRTDAEYAQEGGLPIIFHNVRIVYYQSQYVMQAPIDGMRKNRREAFRVGVGSMAKLRMNDNSKPGQVMIRDISITGFSITDRKKELNFKKGDIVPVLLEELGHTLNLKGRVVRIEEHPDLVIYGLQIVNMCKDLSSYVTFKQRRNRINSK